jgi:hypothetical protein
MWGRGVSEGEWSWAGGLVLGSGEEECHRAVRCGACLPLPGIRDGPQRDNEYSRPGHYDDWVRGEARWTSSPRVFIGGLSSGFLQKTKRLGTKLQHLLAFQQL